MAPIESGRLVRFLLRLSPTEALFWGVAPGVVLILAARLLGILEFSYTVGGVTSERGFLAAVSWSVSYTALLALFVYFVSAAMQAGWKAGDLLAGRRMLLDAATGQPVESGERLRLALFEKLDAATRAMVAIAIAALLWSAYEWWTSSGGPLLAGTAPAEGEIDWQLKSLYSPETGPVANTVFAGLAFAFQAGLVSLLGVFVIFVRCFSATITSLEGAGLRLQPDLRSDDRRRGFEVFEGVVTNILLASAVVYGMFYLTRLWNAYLHGEPSPNLGSFIAAYVFEGFKTAGATAGLGRVFEVGAFTQSGGFVGLAALIIFVWVYVGVAHILGNAAKEARALGVQRVGSGVPDEWSRLTPEECHERLASMTFWPVHYPKPMQLMALIGFAVFCLIWYRLGLIYLGIVALAVFQSMIKSAKKLDAS